MLLHSEDLSKIQQLAEQHQDSKFLRQAVKERMEKKLGLSLTPHTKEIFKGLET